MRSVWSEIEQSGQISKLCFIKSQSRRRVQESRNNLTKSTGMSLIARLFYCHAMSRSSMDFYGFHFQRLFWDIWRKSNRVPLLVLYISTTREYVPHHMKGGSPFSDRLIDWSLGSRVKTSQSLASLLGSLSNIESLYISSAGSAVYNGCTFVFSYTFWTYVRFSGSL